MHDVTVYIVLLIVTIAHLREIIAKLFGIPRSKKWSWIFYGDDDKEVVRQTLIELGINSDNVRNAYFLGKNNSRDDKKIELLEFISKVQIAYAKEVTYGATTYSKSKFYINTMEAAQIPQDLSTMENILFNLINRNINTQIDFIITPKSGNPLLGKKIADVHGFISILGKHDKEGSFAHIDPNDYHNRLITNFEGSVCLLTSALNSTHRKLKGIVVDCNASGGSQILTLMKSFNEIVNQNQPEFSNIEPIDSAFILFRPDIDDLDIDGKFSQSNFKLHRWFDLDEEIKTTIHESVKKLNCHQLDSNIKTHKKEIDKIFLMMQKKNLIKQA